jgi:hypothetical protein
LNINDENNEEDKLEKEKFIEMFINNDDDYFEMIKSIKIEIISLI